MRTGTMAAKVSTVLCLQESLHVLLWSYWNNKGTFLNPFSFDSYFLGHAIHLLVCNAFDFGKEVWDKVQRDCLFDVRERNSSDSFPFLSTLDRQS